MITLRQMSAGAITAPGCFVRLPGTRVLTLSVCLQGVRRLRRQARLHSLHMLTNRIDCRKKC